MSDSLPQPEPDNTEKQESIAAQNVPNSPTDEIEDEDVRVPEDPAAIAADRAGFKFLAIGFAIFFAIIAIFAGVVAMVMKNMGI